VALDVVSVLFPQRCAGCDARGAPWCVDCDAQLAPLSPVRCARCGTPTRWAVPRCRQCLQGRHAFARAWSAVAHDGAAAALLRRWKDGGIDLSGVAAAAILRQLPIPPEPGAVVVPVPAEKGRARWRGVDGPAALATHLADAWGLDLRRDLLVRAKATPPQRRLSAPERQRNLAGAFTTGSRYLGPAILVDDVYTTGATANVCSRVLERVGAGPVVVVTFARALRR
jgi:predicted amidophosphoribosyltransferase